MMTSRTVSKNVHRKSQLNPYLIVALVAFAVIVVGGIWLAISGSRTPRSEVSVAEAATLRDQGALFLDIRTAD